MNYVFLQQQIPKQKSCNLIGSSGIIVQMFLAIISFSILIVKRFYEVPQRPLKIWFLDTSKQILSQLITHLGNVIFSLILSTKTPKNTIPGQGPDECNFYLMTLLIDTTICVYCCGKVLQQVEIILKQNGLETFKSGNYYKTSLLKRIEIIHEEGFDKRVPMETIEFIEIHYFVWFVQLAIWLSVCLCVKSSIFLLQYLMYKQLGQLSFYAIIWLNPFPLYKLIFVMMIVPTFMNMLLFWIQDNFLKKSVFSEDEEEIEEIDEFKHNMDEMRQIKAQEAQTPPSLSIQTQFIQANQQQTK